MPKCPNAKNKLPQDGKVATAPSWPGQGSDWIAQLKVDCCANNFNGVLLKI